MSATEKRRRAWERLVLAWCVAITPNLLVAFGVDFSGGWMVIRYVLSAIFIVALAAFLVALWQERRERPSRRDRRTAAG
jgi:hypothetical protein